MPFPFSARPPVGPPSLAARIPTLAEKLLAFHAPIPAGWETGATPHLHGGTVAAATERGATSASRSPAPRGWESRQAWEVALLVGRLPAEARVSFTAVLPTLLPLVQPWQAPPRTTPTGGPPTLQAPWACVERQRLTPRELAARAADLERQLRQELRLGLRTLATPEATLGRGSRNGLLDALGTRLGQVFAALAWRVGWRAAHQTWEQLLAERR